MIRSTVLLILLVLLAGCSTHFSTLQPEGSKEQIIYAVPEEQAFQIAHGSLAVTLPGRKIEVIDGPVRGYSTYFRFVLDTYTQQVLVHAAQGTDALGKKEQLGSQERAIRRAIRVRSCKITVSKGVKS